MSLISKVAVRILVLTALTCSSVSARAEFSLLGGLFIGDELVSTLVSEYEACHNPVAYQMAAFGVQTTGSYNLIDALDNLWGYGSVAVITRVYQGQYDPGAPDQNLLPSSEYGRYSLSSGVDYVLVVQQGCADMQEGPWAIWFEGPGSVASQSAISEPGFTRGRFSQNDPTMTSGCGSVRKLPYHQSGPIRVSHDGHYFFSDTSMKWSIRVCLQVYTAPVDPADPSINLVGYVHYGKQQIELEAGRDYYFVTQNLGGQTVGDFLYVLVPPAQFRINSGLTGSWYNPATPGQGFFLAVYEKLNKAFLGWFTYANAASAGGGFSHRWMTAFGPFASTSAELGIDWTVNGGFDTLLPEPERFRDGTISLEFTDCLSGEIRYAWDGDGESRPAASGVIPIRRIANDSVDLCESLYRTPGLPGPL